MNQIVQYYLSGCSHNNGKVASIFSSTENKILLLLVLLDETVLAEELPEWVTVEAGDKDDPLSETVELAPVSSRCKWLPSHNGEFRGVQFSTSTGMSEKTFIFNIN